MALNEQVLNNTLEFLRRVDMKGLEAFAFVQAYTALQNEHQLATNPQLAAAIAAQQALAKPEAQPPTPSTTQVDPPPPTPVALADGTTQEVAVEEPILAESTKAVLAAAASAPPVEEPPAQAEHVFKQGPVTQASAA